MLPNSFKFFILLDFILIPKKVKKQSGGHPPTPPVKAPKVSKYLLSASHRPHIARGRLAAAAHAAVGELHEPSDGREPRAGGRRPIVVRLHARERTHIRATNCFISGCYPN
jgi:hypothetical protein